MDLYAGLGSRRKLFPVRVRSDEFFGIGFVDGDWFFNEHVQAGLERLNADRGMRVVRGRDEHRVHEARGDHLVGGGKAAGAGLTRSFCRIGRYNGGQFEAFDFA